MADAEDGAEVAVGGTFTQGVNYFDSEELKRKFCPCGFKMNAKAPPRHFRVSNERLVDWYKNYYNDPEKVEVEKAV